MGDGRHRAGGLQGAGRLTRPAVFLRLAAACLVPAIALALAVHLHPSPQPGDVWLTKAVQRVDALDQNAGWVNEAGDWRAIPLVAAAALAAIGWRAGGGGPARGRVRAEALVAFALAAVLLVGSGRIKALVESPRPGPADGLRVEGTWGDFGFPSGHVYGDVVVYGAMAVLAAAWVHPRGVPLARALLVAVITLAGPVRVVVGAHWPSDTLGGYLFGGAALCLCLALARATTQR